MAQKIVDFSKKIEHLKGILGAYLSVDSFQDKKHAETCHVTRTTYSHKKAGRAPFQPDELGRLIHLFQLEPEFSYEDFYKPFDEFVAKLRRHGIGSYSQDPALLLCDQLASMADPNLPIQIRRIAKKNAIGGIGVDASDPTMPQLRRGDHVRLYVPIPTSWPKGHLVVLNFSPLRRGGVSCLMPSPFAPFTEVEPQKTELPTLDGIQSSYPVSFPAGPRPIFAIWSKAAPETYVSLPEERELRVVELSMEEILALTDAVTSTQDKQARELAVFRADYHVE